MDWNNYFFDIVDVVATKSKDPDTKHGCVIVDKDHHILATGYNNPPTGMMDQDHPERFTRPLKYKYMVHAERNAIFHAAKKGISLDDATLYVSGIPCMDCAHAIIQSGIYNVIYDYYKQQKWDSPVYQDHGLVLDLFRECSVGAWGFQRGTKLCG